MFLTTTEEIKNMFLTRCRSVFPFMRTSKISSTVVHPISGHFKFPFPNHKLHPRCHHYFVKISSQFELITTQGNNVDIVKHNQFKKGRSSECAKLNDKTLTYNTATTPLCIILGWTNASRRHIMKYADIYLNHGFDILFVNFYSRNILWPVLAKGVAKDLIDFIQANSQYNQIIVHGFSIGGYLWGLVLCRIYMSSKTNPFQNRLIGQVWDSIASPDGDWVPRLTNAFFPNSPILRPSMELFLKCHLFTFPHVTMHFEESLRTFRLKPFRVPTLVLCSKADIVSLQATVVDYAEHWKTIYSPVQLKTFNDSRHVSHMIEYPEEYHLEVENFLKLTKAASSHPSKTTTSLDNRLPSQCNNHEIPI